NTLPRQQMRCGMAADEQWVPVTGYEGLYEVSSWGAVRSLDRIIVRRDGQCRRLRGRVLAGGKHSTGYRSVVLSAGDAQKSVLVHRLVADAFCPRKDEACEVNHKNGVKDDNRA